MASESKTPRTDQALTDGWSGDAFLVPTEFARQLEMELNASLKECSELRTCLLYAEDAAAKGDLARKMAGGMEEEIKRLQTGIVGALRCLQQDREQYEFPEAAACDHLEPLVKKEAE